MVWGKRSHLSSRAPPPPALHSIYVWVSCFQRERGQQDICFMSGGSVALGSGVIGLPLSVGVRNTDLSFLRETLRTRVPTVWGGAAERNERKNWSEVEGRGWGWRTCSGKTGGRKWQRAWSDKPLARTPSPWGRTGGYKTSASALGPATVPDDPFQPGEHCAHWQDRQ